MSDAMSSIETLSEPFVDGPEAGDFVDPFVLHCTMQLGAKIQF
jgi:hypothetical protein